MSMRRLFLMMLSGTLLTLLAGCGFHLRGDQPTPPELSTLYLKTDKPYDTLSNTLTSILQSANVTLVATQQDAPITLHIIRETEGETLANVGTNTTTRQYNLTYSVVYQVLDRKGNRIIGPFSANENSALMTSSNQVLSSSQSQANLQQQMQQQAAGEILNVLLAPDTVSAIQKAEANGL